MAPSTSSRQAGFTLVETLSAVAIVGVLLRFAVPELVDVTRAMQLANASAQLVSELNHARSEAIRRNLRVVVCKSRDGGTCAQDGSWDQGWIVFHDDNNNARREAGEHLVRRGEGAPGGLRIVGNEMVSRYVSFSGFGGPRLPNGAFQAGTITVCRASLQRSEARQLIINSVGRARVQKVALESCE